MSALNYYPPGDVGEAFLKSDAFIRGIRGPIGSGKSALCVAEIVRRASQQKPGPDGLRKTRWVIIRNTYPELRTTTINTYNDWVPRDKGAWLDTVPITHRISTGDIRMEVLFLALDRPEDIKKLLSLEVTGGWINEAREVPKAVLDALTGRVGRYPSMRDGGATWSGVIMDTNAPDSEHWWPKMADGQDAEMNEHNARLEAELRKMGALDMHVPLVEFFSQPPGTHPDAENIQNLIPGYYLKASAGKKADWIKVYINNQYGFVQEGRPVIEEYQDAFHSDAGMPNKLQYVPAWGLRIGLDFGLTPAAVFGQRDPMGRWNILSEIVSERMGAEALAEQIKAHLGEKYPNMPPNGLISIIGDPAGDQGAQTDERTVFQALASKGVVAMPASTNDFMIRREAVAQACTRFIDGRAGLLVSENCPKLRKALSGGYQFRKLLIASQDRYETKPSKNMHSHVAEALQYLLVGGGEGKLVIKRPAAMTAGYAARPESGHTNW